MSKVVAGLVLRATPPSGSYFLEKHTYSDGRSSTKTELIIECRYCTCYDILEPTSNVQHSSMPDILIAPHNGTRYLWGWGWLRVVLKGILRTKKDENRDVHTPIGSVVTSGQLCSPLRRFRLFFDRSSRLRNMRGGERRDQKAG